MSRDEIIRIAVQCQLVTTANRDGVYMDALERFATLIGAAEREACAKVCINEANVCELSCFISDQDKVSCLRSTAFRLSVCAEAIRARGEK